MSRQNAVVAVSLLLVEAAVLPLGISCGGAPRAGGASPDAGGSDTTTLTWTLNRWPGQGVIRARSSFLRGLGFFGLLEES
jgi:hypothetical protein